MLGYAFASYSATTIGKSLGGGSPVEGGADGRFFALSALYYLVNIVYSAVIMQPPNNKWEGLGDSGKSGEAQGKGEGEGAVELGQRWITGNYLTIVYSAYGGDGADNHEGKGGWEGGDCTG
jgi:hypothetical protein